MRKKKPVEEEVAAWGEKRKPNHPEGNHPGGKETLRQGGAAT